MLYDFVFYRFFPLAVEDKIYSRVFHVLQFYSTIL